VIAGTQQNNPQTQPLTVAGTQQNNPQTQPLTVAESQPNNAQAQASAETQTNNSQAQASAETQTNSADSQRSDSNKPEAKKTESPPTVNAQPVDSARTIGNITALLEQSRDKEFSQFFGRNLSNKLSSSESIRDALSTIASQTENQSAIIYVTALPDQLELVVFTPKGRPIRRAVPEAKREELLKVVSDFRDKITAPRLRNSTSYLQPAQQLYQWLIAPIESELTAAKIDTLLFSMDAGLRSVPMAALHDGKQFLVEKYSLALIPSVSLMDTRYQSLKGALRNFATKIPCPQCRWSCKPLRSSCGKGKLF
jgi:CHAT domain-containing protein